MPCDKAPVTRFKQRIFSWYRYTTTRRKRSQGRLCGVLWAVTVSTAGLLVIGRIPGGADQGLRWTPVYRYFCIDIFVSIFLYRYGDIG